MQIVIDMPDEEYKRLTYIDILKLRGYIENGTLLPKGHGRLIDVNEVEEYLNDIQFELDGWGETDGAVEIAKARMGLDSVSTIIEADELDREV